MAGEFLGAIWSGCAGTTSPAALRRAPETVPRPGGADRVDDIGAAPGIRPARISHRTGCCCPPPRGRSPPWVGLLRQWRDNAWAWPSPASSTAGASGCRSATRCGAVLLGHHRLLPMIVQHGECCLVVRRRCSASISPTGHVFLASTAESDRNACSPCRRGQIVPQARREPEPPVVGDAVGAGCRAPRHAAGHQPSAPARLRPSLCGNRRVITTRPAGGCSGRAGLRCPAMAWAVPTSRAAPGSVNSTSGGTDVVAFRGRLADQRHRLGRSCRAVPWGSPGPAERARQAGPRRPSVSLSSPSRCRRCPWRSGTTRPVRVGGLFRSTQGGARLDHDHHLRLCEQHWRSGCHAEPLPASEQQLGTSTTSSSSTRSPRPWWSQGVNERGRIPRPLFVVLNPGHN